MKLRALDTVRDELVKGKLYTGQIIKADTDGFYFVCFNETGKWRQYGLWYFEPSEAQ